MDILGIVRSFVDGGKTGVTIKRRRGLQDLLDVVESGMANFRVVIVYDVSRWGRFPDNDESAHYEFVCKRAGISVQYCAEQFENDNSPTSNLLKALKRTMASEYSRELSTQRSHHRTCALCASFLKIIQRPEHFSGGGSQTLILSPRFSGAFCCVFRSSRWSTCFSL
jgi:hypothetical protein